MLPARKRRHRPTESKESRDGKGGAAKNVATAPHICYAQGEWVGESRATARFIRARAASFCSDNRQPTLMAVDASALGETRPAGGKATILDYASGPRITAKPVVPPALRTDLVGAGNYISSGRSYNTRPGSPRTGSSSPRYMQATRSSAAMSAVPNDACNIVAHEPVDITGMDPAGGYANDLMKSEIDFEDAQRRPLRRSLSVPRRHPAATTASITGDGAYGGEPLESPRALASRRLAEAGMVNGPPSARQPIAGTPVRVDRPIGVRRPPTAPNMFSGPAPFGAYDKPSAHSRRSTHDKSIPNPPRSRKASGVYVPGPAITTEHALASAPPSFITDGGFDSVPMPRLGRTTHEPIAHRPGGVMASQALSNPNDVGQHDSGARAEVSNVKMLGSRRRRGTYSPAVPMGGTNPIAWSAEPS